ncbi:MAG: queuosine precursor transporter [bacterium]|nr:queuosine precursor transporter [bacterium]
MAPSPSSALPQGSGSNGFSRAEASYAFCASLFVVVLVLTNVIGTKLFVLFPEGRPDWIIGSGPINLTSGIITYPATFLLTDLVSEIWGRKRASFMVVSGFAMSLLMLGVLKMAVSLPPSPFWTNAGLGFESSGEMQLAYDAAFASPWILLGASMLAYLVAQLFDVRLYHFWWKLTGGRHMWLRNNGSTWISQLVDTIIVNTIFLHFHFRMAWSNIVQIIVATYLCKVLLALLDTPLIYLGRIWVERFLGIEHDAERARAPLA